MPSSAPVGQWFFSGYSSFHPLLINDRLDISAIFLKGHKTQIFFFSVSVESTGLSILSCTFKIC